MIILLSRALGGEMKKDILNEKIFSGFWGKCHCQGIALDKEKKYIYYSFTTKLVKSDLEGNIIGTVDNIIGHLGCIDFNDADGKIYASLEYKNDSIGRGILKSLGASEESLQDGFYIAIFDVDKIDRMEMDAEKDGIMRTVYLKTVVDDYEGVVINGGQERKHILGCSGIDGLTIGADFGDHLGEKKYLCVCYGVYSDTERTDNDYQVILQYEFEDWWDKTAKPLCQNDMHRQGPDEPRRKYFLYTGNTTYGVQNLEYDERTGDYFLCVYRGKKADFPNYPMFVIDGAVAAREESLKGFENGERGLVLTLKETGLSASGISGIEFEYGSTGFYSIGDGRFYVSENFSTEDKQQATNVCLYRLDTEGKIWRFEKTGE